MQRTCGRLSAGSKLRLSAGSAGTANADQLAALGARHRGHDFGQPTNQWLTLDKYVAKSGKQILAHICTYAQADIYTHAQKNVYMRYTFSLRELG